VLSIESTVWMFGPAPSGAAAVSIAVHAFTV
jgi:hypothetical protein